MRDPVSRLSTGVLIINNISMKDIFLSVIIPAYNEEQRIKKTLEDLQRYFSQKKYAYEILIVDDGSTDKTQDVILKFKNNLNISLLKNDKNFGKGYSVKKGMLAVIGEYKLFMDADNSVPIEYFDKFLPYLNNGFDIVIGSIVVDGAKIKENVSHWRNWLGGFAKLIIRIVILPDILDSQRGFKVFSQKAADVVFRKQELNGFGFDIEILATAKQNGFKIKELPVVWSNPKGSKVGLRHYFFTILDLIAIKKNIIARRYE